MRGDDVASSIDSHVREALEKLVGEIRSSVEDVREAVDQQLKAAVQSVQADVSSITFLPHIKKTIAELETSLKPKEGAPSKADVSRVKKAIQNVEQGKSQVDVLNALLEQSVQFGSRAALLILRGETFSGWKGMGFSSAGGNDENVKRFNAAPGLIPELDRVLKYEHVVIWDGNNLSTRLGVSGSVRAILVPMVIKDKVAAAVYVDVVDQDQSKFDPGSLEILVFATGLLIDTLAIRKKIPSPSLSEAGESSGAFTAPPQPKAAEATVGFAQELPPPVTPRPVAPPPPPKPAPAPPPKPAAAPPPPPKPAPAAAPKPSAYATTAMPAFDLGKSGPMPAIPGEEASRASTQFVPPAGMARGSAAASAPDANKKHDEARRFARLLVSEIKLYNEPKVEQGRKNKDLYERLKEDIDRSRSMYDERISEDIRKSSNYFYDELVRILADGDAGALGL
ncbi:MAG: hypothetical protein M3041_02790 [Acidobacteriota bacterium]|nr:hypothetical protein [Acidobacteriota bacterium]